MKELVRVRKYIMIVRSENMLQNRWFELLKEEWSKGYYTNLQKYLEEELKKYHIYPPQEEIFQALHKTDYDDVSVVILGQDPYHGFHQANGLSFSVSKGEKIPPSLRNMYKELQNDIGIDIPSHGNLVSWAEQGVLLLNTVLTVRDGEANSHKGKGWEVFTDKIITLLNEREQPIVFVLWGNQAKLKKKLINENHHYIIEGVHPSPLSASRGFFGSKPYSKINNILRELGRKEIDWSID